MFLENLPIARDAAIVLLAIESLIFLLVPLVVLYMITRLLGKALRQFVPMMRKVQAQLAMIASKIQQIMAALCAPFIWISSTYAGIRAGAAGLRRTLGGR